jgi:hypothetical protein
MKIQCWTTASSYDDCSRSFEIKKKKSITDEKAHTHTYQSGPVFGKGKGMEFTKASEQQKRNKESDFEARRMTMRIGFAKGDLFPTLLLTGIFGRKKYAFWSVLLHQSKKCVVGLIKDNIILSTTN